MKKMIYMLLLLLTGVSAFSQTKIRVSQIEDIQGTYIKSLGETTTSKVLTTNGSGGAGWQIPLFLPLSGGTLTGTLNGTLASFSGALTVAGTIRSSSVNGWAIGSLSGVPRIDFVSNQFRALSASDTYTGFKGTTFESTLATGTPPLTVASTTLVSNLNADLLDGKHLTDLNTAGTLANVAYLNQNNLFTANQHIGTNTLSWYTSYGQSGVNSAFAGMLRGGRVGFISGNGIPSATVSGRIDVNTTYAYNSSALKIGGASYALQLVSKYNGAAGDELDLSLFTSDLSGNIDIPASTTYKIGGASINTAGTLSNVAYKNAANTFTAISTFNSNIVLNTSGTLASSGTGLNLAAGIGTGRLLSGTNLSSFHTWADDAALELSVGSSAAYKTGISLSGRYWSGTTPDEIGFWTRGVKNIVINGIGNVGIGTSAPTSKLHLYDDGSVSPLTLQGNTPSITQSLERASGGIATAILKLNAKNTTTGLTSLFSEIGVLGSLNSGTTKPTITYMYMGADSIVAYNNNTFRLYPNKIANFQGDVGIGTATPASKLHVSSTTSGLISAFESTGSAGYLQFRESTVVRGYLGYGDNGQIFTGATSNSLSLRSEADLHLGGTGNNLTMTLTGGNVGIGTAAPTEKLHVNGKTKTSTFQMTTGAFSGYVMTSDVSGNATWASYTETDPTVYAWAKTTTKPAYTWSEVTGKPSFATVATSGSYDDLSNKPAIPTNTNQLTNGAGFISSYTETDPSIYAWAKATTKPAYTWSEVTGKPSFATVATSGSYDDLINKPTIPTNTNQLTNGAGFISSYTETDPSIYAWAKATTKPAYTWTEVTGKPTLATVATSGSYSDLINTPSIPTNTNQLTNGAGFITGYTEIDGLITNEGVTGVVSSSISNSVLLSTNTSGASGTLFTAGNGMTVTGAYQSDGGSITYTLGTPSVISSTSTNSVTGNTHTHQLSIYGTPSEGQVIQYTSTYGLAWVQRMMGSGLADKVAVYDGTNSLTYDADYSFDGASNALTVGSSYYNGSITAGTIIAGSVFNVGNNYLGGSLDIAQTSGVTIRSGYSQYWAGTSNQANFTAGGLTYDLRKGYFIDNAAPASSSASGTTGSIKYDSNYIYICTSTNTWKRTALTTW